MHRSVQFVQFFSTPKKAALWSSFRFRWKKECKRSSCLALCYQEGRDFLPMNICLTCPAGNASFAKCTARNVGMASTISICRYDSSNVQFQKVSILYMDTFASHKRKSFLDSRENRCKVLQHRTRIGMLSTNRYELFDVDKFACPIICECGDGRTNSVSLTELCNEIESAFFEVRERKKNLKRPHNISWSHDVLLLPSAHGLFTLISEAYNLVRRRFSRGARHNEICAVWA